MGADFQMHTGTIRFGPEFHSHRNHARWDGKVSLIADLYDLDLCHLFVIAGKVRTSDYRDILRCCEGLGFKRVHQTREEHGKFFKQQMDLTKKPYRWRRLSEITL